jgi:tetrachlorobenzoquinone reductase
MDGAFDRNGRMRARIRSISWEAEGINAYRLEPLRGEHFTPFTAGSHIDVRLPTGISRSYSLLNTPDDVDVYEIGIQKAPDSRGGSRYIHENWRAGDIIDIGEPRNNFPMIEEASHTVLIAGGIGVTPMLSMIARLEALGRDWNLHYASASQARAAFLDRLQPYDQVETLFDDNTMGLRLDLAQAIAEAPEGAHIYCCGPQGMLVAFEALMASRPGFGHVEYFSAETELATEGGYTLELSKSGRIIAVEEGETMLDALLTAGVDVGFACSEGVCGSCRVTVLEGVPDHRDHFLTREEKEANRAVMVCCSGSKTASLVLDL